MNELEIKKVPFMGTELMAARDNDGQIWAGVRWMCDGIGLSKGQLQRQITNIGSDRVLSKGVANLQLPTKGGVQEVLCLRLNFVPLWLAKINITPAMEADNPELADRLEQYQLKAKDVLAAALMPELYDEPEEPEPVIAQRMLTPDDFLRAAAIVSSCRNERLAYVLDFLAQGGFELRDVEAVREKKYELAALLNRAVEDYGLSDSKIGELTGTGRMQIWRYRNGVIPRSNRRAERIMEMVNDAISQM